MPSWLIRLLRDIAIAVGILVAAGSIGHALNLCNPQWHQLGVSGAAIRREIVRFPEGVCAPILRPACRKMSDATLWFIGLDKASCE